MTLQAPTRALTVLLLAASGGCFSPGGDSNPDPGLGDGVSATDAGDSTEGGTTGGASTTAGSTDQPSGGPASGPDDGSTGEAGETTGDESSGSTGEPLPPACAETEVCLPAIPEGWQGPITLVDETLSPDCPASMPQERVVAHTDLEVGAMACDCDCGTPADTSCAMTLFQRVVQCADEDFSPHEMTVVSNTCEILQSTAVSWIHDVDTIPAVSGGSCPPIANHSIPEPVWNDTLRACETEIPAGACETDGVCVPDDVFTPMCIVHPGDVECPGLPWAAKTTAFESIADDRACSNCLCSTPAGQCSGTFEFHAGSSCGASPLASYDTSDQCIDEPTASRVEFLPDGAEADCSPIGGAPSGDAAPSDPVTVCCLP